MKLDDRLDDGLNEVRMLLLGGQVFAGFTYTSCFEAGFQNAAASSQWMQALAITLITSTMGWLMWPAAFHQIVDGGRTEERSQRLTSRVLDISLLPLAFGVGFCAQPVAVQLRMSHARLVTGLIIAVALFAWYALPIAGRAISKETTIGARPQAQQEGEAKDKQRRNQTEPEAKQDSRQEELEQRIKKVLTECRMVLPGSQAFLGFLFANVFEESFTRLPRSSQWVHVASIGLVLLSTILLLTPAAYHRIATHGEATELVHRAASACLLAGMFVLAPGMAGELYVVLRKLVGMGFAVGATTAMLMMCFGLWFVASWLMRGRRPPEDSR